MEKLTDTRAIYLTLALVFGPTACRGPMPCPDCDDSADDMQVDDMQEDPVPDLPCGGADLMTDSRNCGTCGNDCRWYPDTDWEVGSCQMGVCVGPLWSNYCYWEGYGATCEQICAGEFRSCVAKGCSGHTALRFWQGGDTDWCGIPDEKPYATMDGPCDEPIPWEHNGFMDTVVLCCCG
jgi:hypothetical protein